MAPAPLLEWEIETPCAEGETHPVRIALYGWGDFEVVWNPCEERLGVFGALAPCQAWLNARFDSEQFAPLRLTLVQRLVESLGADAVPHLIQALKDENADVRRASAQALGNLKDPQATPHLIQALKDENADVRKASAQALGTIQDPQATPHLIQALKDRDADVREASAQALGKIQDPQATPHLIQTLKDEDADVRQASAEALVKIGAPAVPHLIQALGDWDASVRQASVVALGKIKDATAVPALSLVLHCQATEEAARVALEQLGHSPLPLDEAIEQLIAADEWGLLIRALPEVSEVEEAFVALGASAIPHLVPALLEDVESRVRAACAQTLGNIGDPHATPHLIQTLKDKNAGVRKASAQALGNLKDPQATPHLIQALKDEDADVRKASAQALGRIGEASALPAL